MTIADQQNEFYDGLYERHGDDPRALSYRDERTQRERFERIALLFGKREGAFGVHEIGCGLGHFGSYLAKSFPQARYSGSDINPRFVDACRARFPGGDFRLRDVSRERPLDRHDFVTLSGTFNVPLGTPREDWRRFIGEMLEAMWAMATRGIAVNFLSSYCDAGKMRADLHYQPEVETLDFVARRLSRHFELDCSGPLYEYTVRVYRPRHVSELYPEPEFDRYVRREER